MKVLHVLASLDHRSGGPLRGVLHLSHHISVHGVETEIVGAGERRIADLPVADSQITDCRIWLLHSYAYCPDLRRWLRANLQRFDGVVLHGLWQHPPLVGGEECICAGVPYACMPHGMLEPWAIRGQGILKRLKKSLYWNLFEKRIYSRAAVIVYGSRRERELARGLFASPAPTFVIPPFGIERAPKMAADPPRPEVLRATGRNYVLFLGRIHPKKNLEFLIRAWAGSQPGADWRLVIAGPAEPRYLEKLKRLADASGAAGKVVFLGFVSGADKQHLLRNAQWLVLPSKQENFGIVVLEALQYGCPVAVSDQVFLADELEEGLVVLGLQPEEWVRFFRDRMADAEYRRDRAENGARLALAGYEIGSVTERWAGVLRDAFRHSPGRTTREARRAGPG